MLWVDVCPVGTHCRCWVSIRATSKPQSSVLLSHCGVPSVLPAEVPREGMRLGLVLRSEQALLCWHGTAA